MHPTLWVSHGNITHYTLPFQRDDASELLAGEPIKCRNPVAAVRHAEALSRAQANMGAVAFSQTSDPGYG